MLPGTQRRESYPYRMKKHATGNAKVGIVPVQVEKACYRERKGANRTRTGGNSGLPGTHRLRN